MSERRLFNQDFSRELAQAGYDVNGMKEAIDGKQDAVKVVRQWTGLSNNTIRDGLFNETRDVVIPRIEQEVLATLSPWIGTKTDEDLPAIQTIQLVRSTGLSPERIIDALSRYPLTVAVNGSTFTSAIQVPEFPKQGLTPSDASDFGVSPKRVVRDARYLSRPPGGGAVQKAKIQESKIDGIIKREARRRAQVVFEPVVTSEEIAIDSSDLGAMEELSITTPDQITKKSIQEIIYSEPNGRDIMNVFQWLKETGFGRNWVLGNSEQLLAESLTKFSRGESTDFLIWNCIGFKWFGSPDGQFPTCNITNNLDVAISLYFRNKVQEMAETLATIGDPNITILVPSNEAFDERAWQYRQPYDEREKIINDAVEGLRNGYEDVLLPPNATVNVMRWDDFIQSRGVERDLQEYSSEGERRVRESDNFNKIVREAIKSGRSYFGQNGIGNVSDEAFAERQPRYYGVYAGEGVAFEELQQKGRNIVVINFEEMRVPQMAYLGARGNLPVITPITEKEMVGYYRWEARKIQER